MSDTSGLGTNNKERPQKSNPVRLPGVLFHMRCDDLQRYIDKRKRRDPEFAEEFEKGYAKFKAEAILKEAREETGSTEDEMERTEKS
ncbi:MAG: hypothetical protein AB1631_12285 [Acidobacteriota bacterium]